MRARLGLRAWRAVHWAAYACWPVAVLHGLGTGTDAGAAWLQAMTAVCVAGVVAALAARLLAGWPARAGLRLGALALVAASVVGTVAFAMQGPLKPGWARRAGTPPTLLAAARTPLATRPASAPATVALPFTASLDGSSRQIGAPGDGRAQVDIAARVHVAGDPLRLVLRLSGRALPGGGLEMMSSSVRLGPSATPGPLSRPRGGAARQPRRGSPHGGRRPRRPAAPGAEDRRRRGRGRDRRRARGVLVSAAAALPRLLRGIEDGRTLTLAAHLRVHGPLETAGRDAGARLLDAMHDSGLRGRGGAHVSTALKLRAVAGRRRRAVVVANGSESEPASRKDAVLLSHAPHLVIDGAMVAAAAIGADEVILYVKRSDPRVWSAVERAVDERRVASERGPALRLVAAPSSYVSGQETAAIAHLNGRPALPTTVPPRPFERGVDHRPTLICNVETLAHIALIARHGAGWFRALGIADTAGERARDARRRRRATRRLRDRLRQPDDRPAARRGRRQRTPQALLVGGYGGAWLDAQHMQELTLSEGDPLLGGGLDRSRRALGPRRALVRGLGVRARARLPRRAERRPMRTRACTGCARSPTASTCSRAGGPATTSSRG